MQKNLLIVFAKNIVLSKVKTRLAKSIGDAGALNVYIKLYEITKKEVSKLKNVDIQIHFSDVILKAAWPNAEKYTQVSGDLGAKMEHAFKQGIKSGYEKNYRYWH